MALTRSVGQGGDEQDRQTRESRKGKRIEKRGKKQTSAGKTG